MSDISGLAQLGVFIWHVITLTNQGKIVGPDGPVYVTGYLIFNPTKKTEVRFPIFDGSKKCVKGK